MMSLGVNKGHAIPSTDEDRRRIIRQMKVRTTLKGDKSWIHHHNSDSEDEKKSVPLSGLASGGSPASTPTAPQSDRSPAAKPQSGYLIRGVFTRTIDKTSSMPDSSSPNEPQKRPAVKGHSLNRSSSGYRMTTEDYKKLAPYNVKQKSVDVDEEDVPFTPDEHKKRTEAANSVLRRTASRERAYVLSAAKKSNGSPTQEFPPLFAKRIEIEEEEGQQRRSPTGSGSCRFMLDHHSTNGLRKNTTESSWNEPKTAAVSPSSTERGSQSQTATASTETSEQSSTAAEIRNGESRQASTGKSSSETVPQRGDGDKPLKEKSELFPWDETASRATVVSTNGSYSEHTEADNGYYPPKSSLQSDVPSPTERAPVHLEGTESSFKRSILGFEGRSSTPESRYTSPEVPPYSKPYWSEATSSQDFKEENTPGERGHETTQTSDDYKPELIQEGILDSTNPTEKGQDPPDYDVRSEPARLTEHTERDPSITRSSSLPRESSSPAPETQHPNGSDVYLDRATPAYGEQTHPTSESHRESPGDWRHYEPNPVAASRSNFSSKENPLSAYEIQHPMTLYTDRQPPNNNVLTPSHRIPSYVDSQAFSTRRPTPDYDGRVYDGSSSPRNSRYDSTGARGHSEFNPIAGRHDSFPRDTTMSISQRSHRVPFYMDTLNYNSTRLLSGSSERICSPMATIQPSSPAASGYQPDSNTVGKGVLFVKEYVNSSELSASPRYSSGSFGDLTDLERSAYSHHSYLSSAPLQWSSDPVCSYCSREIRDCPKIIIEHLNICCHEYCFRCGICHKAMGDLLDKMFIHRDIVHCDKCYEKLF
ncbi:zinc finger protein 185 [Cuculus canorus]|uniref:zinc finger protein 185 n=1 Tax=Cuculus canorus TaxID=55661 RepID=UPI0023AB1842|nr:zinc finger protein 185 [Cuculus canorus]